MGKQPNPDRTLTAYLRETKRVTARQAAAKPNVSLGVPATATTPGVVVGKVEVTDADGVSLGFLALYASIN